MLLIQRGLEPYKDAWALPGGFLRMDETADECAKRELEEEKKRISEQLESASGQDTEAQQSLIEIQSKIAEHSTEIEQKKREIMDLLGNRASTKAKIQHFDTTKEQIQTRKAVVARNILEISTVAEGQNNRLKKYEEELGQIRERIQNYKDKTLDSVIAVTTAKFALFNIQSVIDLTQRDTMDLKTWGTQKTMVYLVIPDNDTTFRFLSALFFSTVFSTLTRQADVDFKGQLPIHVRSYLDEFANVGEIPDFAEQTSTVRSRNMSLVPILQNIAQLQGLYKEKEAWKTILGNCDSLLYLGGNDEETFKFMSGLLGKQTIDVRSTSRSFGQTGSSSTSHQKIARDLMTADEVGNMKRDECLVRIAGVPVFRTKKYFPLKHKNWKWLADKETDERWWHYHINPLTAEEELDLSGHKIRDLSTETTLH